MREGGRIEPRDRAAWRQWLQDNGASSKGAWVAVAKKGHATAGPSYDDAISEAVCFGWVDSTARKLDGERFEIWFSPRRRGSVWAASNKRRVAEAVENGCMAPAGLEAVARAQRDGSWNLLDEIDALVVPPDLAVALDSNPAASEHFTAFPDSSKRMLLYWIASAKRDTTRASRIEQTIAMSAENVRPEQWWAGGTRAD